MIEHREYRENNIIISITVNHPATVSLVKMLSEAPQFLQDLISHRQASKGSGMVLIFCFAHIWFQCCFPAFSQKERNLIA